jgi:multidrug resistance efflux pump
METKDRLPTIPTPASQKWREFRIQVVPFLVFFGSLAAIVVLWRNFVQPVSIVGAAETNTVNVTSTIDGLITQLFVDHFQTVTQGQIIAVVETADKDLINAQRETARTGLLVMRDRMNADKTRSDQKFQQLRTDLMAENVNLATARAKYYAASNEFNRSKAMLADKLLSASQYDLVKATADALAAEIDERTKLITDLKDKLEEFLKESIATNGVDSIDLAIKAKMDEIEETLKPSTLKAPISGTVSFVHHRPGEKILRGTPIVSIGDPFTTRIIAYVRQPITILPKSNDVVQIMTRSQRRLVVRGRIERVGAQLETINPALISVDANRVEMGLPILVSVPEGFQLVPGEFVNLTIESHPR